MHVTAQLAGDERRQHRLGLLGLVVGLAIGGMTLLAVAGPPHLPAALPNGAILASTLNGSYLPPEAVAYVVTTAAWMIWGWLTLSLAFRLAVLGAEAIAYGATWVRALRLISDHVTLPVVRRLVDGAVVTVLVVNLMARAAPASAAPISSSAAVVALSGGEAPGSSPIQPAQESSGRAIRYTVQPGDTLWTISERFYGTGFEYGRLVHANAGRPMPDGSRFTRPGVIQQGWTIEVPLPSQAIEQVDGRTYYVVEDEDTLRGVAARLLGDEAAWCQIFEVNRETARLPDGRALTRPDLIWPGLRLLIPIVAVDGAPPIPSPAPTVAEEASPSPSPGPGTPAIAEPSPEPTLPAPDPAATPEATMFQPPAAPPSVTPKPIGTPVTAEPTTAATPASTDAPPETIEIEPVASPPDEIPAPLTYGAAGLAALAAAGSAVLVCLRRLRRRLRVPLTPDAPEEGPESNDGFAEVELARVLEHRINGGEVEPAIIVADEVLHYFEEHEVDQIDVVTVGQRRAAVSLTLDAGLAAQPRLLELAPELGARLGGTGEAWRTADHDILLRVTGLKLAGLRPLATGRPADAPILLPIGVLPGRETLYANWRELGHMLVAGLPGGGVEVVLTSLIGALTTRCRPGEMHVVTMASRRTLPSALFGLPHQSRKPIDPEDEDAVNEVLQELQRELDRRMRPRGHDATGADADLDDRPEIVVVIGELANIKGDVTAFELLGVHGAVHGIHLLAASTRPEVLGDELLAHFTTRVTLQTLDEDASIRLIGRPDAADLGGGGDLLVRIDGRVPLRARGFRLSPEHLDQLVKVMREAYVGSADSTVKAESTSGQKVTTGADSQRQDDPAVAEHETEGTEARSEIDALVPARHDRSINNDVLANGIGPESASRVNGSHAGPVTSVASDTGIDSGDVMDVSECPLPIQVRCFGTFRVACGDRELSATGSDGAHYKAWDILAFLCAQPGGTVSRERLVGALWPDVDSAKAANRLKVSLTRLRRMLRKQVPGLTGEVVRVERSGVCRLNADYISSDVHRFMALRRSASKLRPLEAAEAFEQARALYRGDLLTEPYYEWVHTRADDGLTLREQYREQYIRVTQQLAELHRQQGQPARAVTLYRDILKLEPTLEDVARSLYRCYQELGDRGALVREHRRLRDAIRRMLSSSDDPDDDPELYEPESETIAVYEEVLADLETRSAVGRPA